MFTRSSILGKKGNTTQSDFIAIDAQTEDPFKPVEAIITFDGQGRLSAGRALVEWGAGQMLTRLHVPPVGGDVSVNAGLVPHNGLQIPVRGTNFRVTLLRTTAPKVAPDAGAFLSLGRCEPPVLNMGNTVFAGNETKDLVGLLPVSFVRRFKLMRQPQNEMLIQLSDLAGVIPAEIHVSATEEMDWINVAGSLMNYGPGQTTSVSVQNLDPVNGMTAVMLVELGL